MAETTESLTFVEMRTFEGGKGDSWKRSSTISVLCVAISRDFAIPLRTASSRMDQRRRT